MKRTIIIAMAVIMSACGGTKKSPEGPQLFSKEAFETVHNGKQTSLYTLTNENGMAVQLTNYGARIVSIWVPDKDGAFRDVTMGFESIDAYLNAGDNNSGPVVGRFGNRIAKGKFTIDGNEYQINLNEGENTLHGGIEGFASKVWEALETTNEKGNPAVVMTYTSPDGEEGFPGKLVISVTYSLTPDNELYIDYTAVTDAPTILNPTSHAYFNLHGTTSKNHYTHMMKINADSFLSTDAALIPTGDLVPVEGTPMDFRKPTAIGERIDSDYEPMVFGKGYDHNYVLNKAGAPGMPELAVEVYEPSTGIIMKVFTDQPGMQFYSGNFMDGSDTGKYGNVHNYRTGFALEAQNFPDAPNHENFPNSVLRPGEVYTQTTIYTFDVIREK